jgi:hypothetical protein
MRARTAALHPFVVQADVETKFSRRSACNYDRRRLECIPGRQPPRFRKAIRGHSHASRRVKVNELPGAPATVRDLRRVGVSAILVALNLDGVLVHRCTASR